MSEKKSYLFYGLVIGFLVYDYVVFQYLNLVVPIDISVFGSSLRSPNILAVFLWIWGSIIIVWCITKLLDYLIEWRRSHVKMEI